MPQLVQLNVVWFFPALLLVAVAWGHFNTPPTNRSGTTFALFYIGAALYYASILALWFLVIIVVSQGLTQATANPEARAQIAPFAPSIAALIILAASQFRQVIQIDTAARSFCMRLAAIPLEAEQLGAELAQRAIFQPPTEQLRRQVTKIISENIDPQALNFSSDGTLSARFTRAVALHRLFIVPNNDGTPLEFPANAHGRSAYARIMHQGEATAGRANARYEELMQAGFAYFTSPHPTKELKESLNRTITELSNLICSLIARYVLYCNVTRIGRRERLSKMGFDAPMGRKFGLDQWAATILTTIILSIAMMTLMPGTHPLPATKIMTIAVTFALSIGFAVISAVLVAQRFIERHEGEKPAYPPFAELTLAALVVAGLWIAMRIGVPLVPALVQGSSSEFQGVITQFWDRLPGIITPLVCTISVGLLCSYVDLLNRTWFHVAVVGAIANGLALMAAAFSSGCCWRTTCWLSSSM